MIIHTTLYITPEKYNIMVVLNINYVRDCIPHVHWTQHENTFKQSLFNIYYIAFNWFKFEMELMIIIRLIYNNIQIMVIWESMAKYMLLR